MTPEPPFGDDSPYPAPPEALPPRPRQPILTTRGRRSRAITLLSFLLGPNLVLLGGWLLGDDLRTLQAEGRTAAGEVIDAYSSPSGRNTVYRVDYRFRVNGADHYGSSQVPYEVYVRHSAGAGCKVTYLPSDPSRSCLGSPSTALTRQDAFVLFVAALVVLVAGSWWVRVEWQIRRETHLAAHGAATVGLVVDGGIVESKNRTRNYWVRYEFSSPEEEHAGGWHWVPELIYGCLPHGKLVTLLYDPEAPRRHLPLYAFQFVKVEPQPVEVEELPPILEQAAAPPARREGDERAAERQAPGPSDILARADLEEARRHWRR